jgi:hypothetical protein
MGGFCSAATDACEHVVLVYPAKQWRALALAAKSWTCVLGDDGAEWACADAGAAEDMSVWFTFCWEEEVLLCPSSSCVDFIII